MVGRLAAITTGVALGLAAVGVGVSPAEASSGGTTGTARACQANIVNNFLVHAKGLECTSTPGIDIVLIRGEREKAFVDADCTAYIFGSGLLPGGPVEQFINGERLDALATEINADGTFSIIFAYGGYDETDVFTVTAPAANGGMITETTLMSC